jgi:hypothetical protein
MGYHVKRERIKGKQQRKGRFTVRHEEGKVTAKGTTLKSALYQRVMLNTIEELREILKHNSIENVYKQVHNPKLDKIRPGGVMESSKVLMKPYEVSDSDEEKEPTKSPEKEAEKPLTRDQIFSKAIQEEARKQKEMDKVQAESDRITKFGGSSSSTDKPAHLQAKLIKNIDLIDKEERDAYDRNKPLSKEEIRKAKASLLTLTHGTGKMSDKQKARVDAWIARAEHNKQKIK